MNPLVYLDPDDPYPESDGLPMAENTEQYDWLVKIKENLEILFADRADVFVAGNLLWYPVRDRRLAGPMGPDVMVVFGRPKGRRGSYRQWEEGGIAPQVVFEIRPPANSVEEMANKLAFYDRHGVAEYYVYDPADNGLRIWLRQGARLAPIAHLGGWTSPRLGVRFALTPATLDLFYPNGRPFLSSVELHRRAESLAAALEDERSQARSALEQARAEAARADAQQARAAAEHARAERLAARLRGLGLDPEGD